MSTASVTVDHLLGEIAMFPPGDRALLDGAIGHRLVAARRREIADQAEEARAVLKRGEVRRGMAPYLCTRYTVVDRPVAFGG